MTEENNNNEQVVSTNNSVLDDLMAKDLQLPTADLTGMQQKEISNLDNQAKAERVIDRLSPENVAAAKQLAGQIDVTNAQSVLTYGSNAQVKLSEFSGSMLTRVQKQDVAGIGDTLSELMYKLNEADPKELEAGNSSFFKKMFGKVKQSIFEITAKYQSIGAQIDNIAVRLDKEKNGLVEDNRMLDNLYKQNLDYFNALNVYIAAAELKIDELNNQVIPEAVQKAQVSGDQMDAQIVQDYQQFLDRLDKRTYDLKLARQITIQQAPQIRLIQNTNQALAEKIQTSINTAIPLWKNQVVIALTLLKQKDAATAQRQVSETTNELLAKNSEMLKISSIETAKENERGIVDIETLQKTQNDLIETIQETLRIQKEGREKRRAAEIELTNMEHDLKAKLLEVSQEQQNIN